MNAHERPIYMRAINDARAMLIAAGNKAYDDGDPSTALVMAECSKMISGLMPGMEGQRSSK